MEKAVSISEAMIPELTDLMESTGTISIQSFEQMRADAYNSEPGSLTGYDCPKCRNKGHIARLVDGVIQNRECECMDKRAYLRNLKASGLEDLARRYTFETYKTSLPWQERAKATALDFAHNRNDGDWFFIGGNPGSGKSHLCTAISTALMESGKQVKYMLWRDVGTAIKAVVNNDEKYRELLNPLKQVQVLYIDDFLKTKAGDAPTAGDINLAFELINYRYNNSRLTTIISTEKSIGDLTRIDEATGSRIAQRSERYRLRLEGADKNMRLRKEGAG